MCWLSDSRIKVSDGFSFGANFSVLVGQTIGETIPFELVCPI